MINVLEYLEQTLEHISDPDKVAFYGADGETLTFRELSVTGRACGSYLAGLGIRKQPVAVFMKKSPAMIAAFLGVVYGGNYYIPLDAEMPAFRIRLILEAVKPALIVCDDAALGDGGFFHASCEGNGGGSHGDSRENILGDGDFLYATVSFNSMQSYPIDDAVLAEVRREAIDADPLYVVFTSGSTGMPKGVIATHRSVIDYIENLSAVLGVSSDTVFGNQSPLYLDACLKEVFSTLKFGSSTYLIPQSLFMFPVKLIEFINDNGINTICWVASALSLVAGLGALKVAIPKSLHTIAFGSEVFPVKHYNLWRETLPDARFIHLYGPTEATGMSTFFEATGTYGLGESIPIGHPFPNTGIVLLDESGNIPEVGQPGEICIRGTCLSSGYFGDTEKTSAAFVQNPLSAFPDKIYRTGDLGRLGTDGELYYISRRDYQIKHMGHRIELAEVEWVANSCDSIGLSCAIFDEVNSRIILYYVAADGMEDSSKSAVRAYLKSNLPRYMLPHSVFQLDDLPRTPGGKLDRVGLLERL